MANLKLTDSDDEVAIPLVDNEVNYVIEQNGTLTRVETPSKRVSAAFLRTGRGWVILDYTGFKTFVNGLRVADFKRVCDRDEIQIGEATVRFSELVVVEVTKDSPLLNPEVICYVDYRGFEVGERVVNCACGELYHVECWDYMAEDGVVHCNRCNANYRLNQLSGPADDRDGSK